MTADLAYAAAGAALVVFAWALTRKERADRRLDRLREQHLRKRARERQDAQIRWRR